MILILAALQAASPAPAVTTVKAADPREARYDRCVVLAASDPAAARAEALRWGVDGGTWFARQCAGLAYTQQGDFAAAAAEFEAAAKAAAAARDRRAANYWAQAGNARLAAGDVPAARSALDTALVAGTLEGLALGEAQLDHARVLVAAGDPAGARRDIDLALTNAADDPLAWLLSATLARRQGDITRAKTDIGEALKRSADDASVQLEAGNIAASAGDEAGARTAWAAAARLAPDAPAGRSATAALAQFAPAAAGR
ncbi:tetratricopeptide repeat protein [Sphingomonas sp. A2-49]|uniref:tetratricopeptide repeat protein n=1 Tax=Sphingomonas sp. A2-49 TaxID=1391375 RepID=UPI0021D1BC9C|nr:tetratricopeptide repeat protein [Sphingomonas sp. A2-49]MCU6453826.1 tetratricopeptide repeat protein [Sphingomonas sp. A2-49]